MKAVFNRGENSRFISQWEQFEHDGAPLNEPELALFHAAYLAGWASGSKSMEGQERLDRAKRIPALAALAHHLQLKVSEQLAQVDVYQHSLAFLHARDSDTLTDHIGLWRLLATLGRSAEAARFMQTRLQVPASGGEAVLLAKTYFDLGYTEDAREILKRYAPDFDNSEAVWLSYANLLIEQKLWDDLFALALQLRHEAHPLRDLLQGYSYYLQGVAEVWRGHHHSAREAFQKLYQAKIRNRIWELSAAETIESLGFSDIAQELLLNIQKDVPKTPEYWMLLARTACETKEPNVLVSALAAAYKLRPDDELVINNYAAALLSTHQRPTEALRLTRKVIKRSPDLPSSKINYCLALLQNAEIPGAETVLKSINPSQLVETE